MSDANTLAALLSDACLLCGVVGQHECPYAFLPVVLGEPVGPELHRSRLDVLLPCPHCGAVSGAPCAASRPAALAHDVPSHPGHFVTIEPGGPVLFVPGGAR